MPRSPARTRRASPRGAGTPTRSSRLDEALRGFTAGSAYAAFAEDRLGVLKAGMRADVTVVDRDLFAVKPMEVLHAKVTVTIVEGETVYKTE